MELAIGMGVGFSLAWLVRSWIAGWYWRGDKQPPNGHKGRGRRMKVWVAETGCYDNRSIQGVYDSPERAMAALPGEKWTRTVWTSYAAWPALTPVEHHESWDNELDWDGAASVRSYEIQGDGPTREPSLIREQRLRPSDGGWDYVSISAGEADGLIAGIRPEGITIDDLRHEGEAP